MLCFLLIPWSQLSLFLASFTHHCSFCCCCCVLSAAAAAAAAAASLRSLRLIFSHESLSLSLSFAASSSCWIEFSSKLLQLLLSLSLSPVVRRLQTSNQLTWTIVNHYHSRARLFIRALLHHAFNPFALHSEWLNIWTLRSTKTGQLINTACIPFFCPLAFTLSGSNCLLFPFARAMTFTVKWTVASIVLSSRSPVMSRFTRSYPLTIDYCHWLRTECTSRRNPYTIHLLTQNTLKLPLPQKTLKLKLPPTPHWPTTNSFFFPTHERQQQVKWKNKIQFIFLQTERQIIQR